MNNKANENKDVFDIKEKITTGSFGSTIFKAYNAALGKEAIAKKYPAALTNDYEGFMLILDQVRACKCPHLVGLYGYYKAVKYFWVVMEYCQGYSISNLMSHLNRPLKEPQIRTVLLHCLRGLEALHTARIIHTRIKASNILITTFGVCKLSEPSPPVSVSDPGISVEGVVGNAYWTAPEVLLEQGWSWASDIWSLGITTIEMAEKQPPYAETHPSRVMVTIPSRPPPHFLNPDAWSKSLKVFLGACLKKDPRNRLSSPQLLNLKAIKKAEYKGMQTMVQKFIKLNQQNSQFYTTQKPPKDRKPVENAGDEDNWAASGTLVWSPSDQSPRRSSEAPAPQPAKAPLRASRSSPGPQRRENITRRPQNATPSQHVDTDTMKRGDFATMKRAAEGIQPAVTVPRLSRASEMTQAEVAGPSRHKVPSGDQASDPPSSRPSAEEETGAERGSGEGVQQPVGKVASDGHQQNPGSEGIEPAQGESSYLDRTVRVRRAEDYTPSYMSFYKDSSPSLIDEGPQEQGTIVRRNSIDERGIQDANARQELTRNLDQMDSEYCADMESLKVRYLDQFSLVWAELGRVSGASEHRKKWESGFYDKLEKRELMLMLEYTNFRHQETLLETKEHFDLQHRFLMAALRNTSDPDQETRYALSISENNEQQAATVYSLNRDYQAQGEEIMRAIERIDFSDAIAVD